MKKDLVEEFNGHAVEKKLSDAVQSLRKDILANRAKAPLCQEDEFIIFRVNKNIENIVEKLDVYKQIHAICAAPDINVRVFLYGENSRWFDEAQTYLRIDLKGKYDDSSDAGIHDGTHEARLRKKLSEDPDRYSRILVMY